MCRRLACLRCARSNARAAVRMLMQVLGGLEVRAPAIQAPAELLDSMRALSALADHVLPQPATAPQQQQQQQEGGKGKEAVQTQTQAGKAPPLLQQQQQQQAGAFAAIGADARKLASKMASRKVCEYGLGLLCCTPPL